MGLLAVVLFAMTLTGVLSGCSRRPRDRYANELLTKLDRVHASLRRCRTSSGVGSKSGLTTSGVAVAVGSSTKEFVRLLDVIESSVYRDIAEAGDYAEWADRTAAALRVKADACLVVLEAITREYREHPNAAKFSGKMYVDGMPLGGWMKPPVWLSPQGELVFAVALASAEGIAVEKMLKLDFRQLLDRIHQQKNWEDAPSR